MLVDFLMIKQFVEVRRPGSTKHSFAFLPGLCTLTKNQIVSRTLLVNSSSSTSYTLSSNAGGTGSSTMVTLMLALSDGSPSSCHKTLDNVSYIFRRPKSYSGCYGELVFEADTKTHDYCQISRVAVDGERILRPRWSVKQTESGS